MEVYTSIIGEHISSDDALKVAHYYEKAQDYGRAGRFYSMCGQYPRALKLFFQCGDREIDAAIEVLCDLCMYVCMYTLA
jgi:WD repeat-containing protein 19